MVNVSRSQPKVLCLERQAAKGAPDSRDPFPHVGRQAVQKLCEGQGAQLLANYIEFSPIKRCCSLEKRLAPLQAFPDFSAASDHKKQSPAVKPINDNYKNGTTAQQNSLQFTNVLPKRQSQKFLWPLQSRLAPSKQQNVLAHVGQVTIPV